MVSMEEIEFNAEKLKELRKKYGLTQKDLAKGIGTTQDLISKWENGQRISASYQKLLRLFFK